MWVQMWANVLANSWPHLMVYVIKDNNMAVSCNFDGMDDFDLIGAYHSYNFHFDMSVFSKHFWSDFWQCNCSFVRTDHFCVLNFCAGFFVWYSLTWYELHVHTDTWSAVGLSDFYAVYDDFKLVVYCHFRSVVVLDKCFTVYTNFGFVFYCHFGSVAHVPTLSVD